MIKATLHAWAESVGVTRETLKRALSNAGIAREKEITAQEIITALTGDKEAAMTRKLNAEAEAKERENRLAAGEIVTIEEAESLYGKKIGALVQQLDSLPALIPGLTLAQRGVLVAKIEECKKQAREAQ